jgi:hypothetical protein
MKNTFDLVFAKKKFGSSQTIYPKPLQFLDQYKKLLKTLANTISRRLELSLQIKVKSELTALINKKSSLYLRKENLEKLSVKNRSLKYYR